MVDAYGENWHETCISACETGACETGACETAACESSIEDDTTPGSQ
jgi:hypothetical protein